MATQDKKLYSPDGRAEVICHASQVANMKAAGWTETKPAAAEPGKTASAGKGK